MTAYSLFPRRRAAARLVAALAALALAALAGCGGPFTADDAVSRSLAVGATPRVVVETFNGRVRVTPGTADRVEAVVTRRGSGYSMDQAQADLANVDVTLAPRGDAVWLVARRADGDANRGNSGADVALTVPTGTRLELRSSNGMIEVVGVLGAVTAATTNAAITVRDGAGVLDLRTTNGAVTVDARDALATVATTNGAIGFTGALAAGAHSFHTTNGAVTLALPAASAFRVDATTTNDAPTTTFAVARTGPAGDATALRGTVGDGDATTIEVRTTNGPVAVLATP